MRVSIAYTSERYRPDSHSVLPSADTPPMSGEPFGMCQVATTRSVAKRITLTDARPAIRDVEIAFPSRLG